MLKKYTLKQSAYFRHSERNEVKSNPQGNGLPLESQNDKYIFLVLSHLDSNVACAPLPFTIVQGSVNSE